MDFTGGLKNNFNSSLYYHYFSGKGFDLRQDLCPSKESSEKESIQGQGQNRAPDLFFENGARRNAHPCPLPTPKRGVFDYQDQLPVADEFPDSKFADFGTLDLLPDETLHILVTGPPNCGKIRLVKALTNNKVQIPDNGDLCLAFKETFAMMGMTVHVNVWYMKNPKDSIRSLKDLFFVGKHFAIALVYDVTVPETLANVPEYILNLRRYLGVNAPIILVGNNTNLRAMIVSDFAMLEWDVLSYHDGQRVKDEYKLAAFVECSGDTGSGVDDMLLKASAVALGDEILEKAMNHYGF